MRYLRIPRRIQFLLPALLLLWTAAVQAQAPYLLKDTVQGSSSSSCLNFTEYKGKVYFQEASGGNGFRLWRTDGTPGGTELFHDFTNPGSTGIFEMLVAGDTLYFVAKDAVYGQEFWKTDGTSAGTVVVKDILPGTQSGFPNRGLAALGDLLFFRAGDTTNGAEVWKTDGTVAGTTVTRDIDPSPMQIVLHTFSFITPMGDHVYFNAYDGTAHGYELWKSDGTPQGTVLVKDINPGSADGALDLNDHTPGQAYTFYGKSATSDRLYFAANDGVHGEELWITDGSEVGTTMLKDLNPGPGNSGVANFTLHDGEVYFIANDGVNGRELWKTDGTETGTTIVKPGISGTPTLGTDLGESLGADLIFQGNDGTSIGGHGHELWKTDGTEQGTVLVKDINPGTADSLPLEFVLADDHVYFVADDGRHGHEIWRTDGTPEGTTLAFDLRRGATGSNPKNLFFADGILYFTADAGTGLGVEPYALDTNAPPPPPPPVGHLTGISTRGRVGTGDEVLIGGFVVEGGPLRVIVRAKGPSLAAAGVTGTLRDPHLQLFSGPTAIATNDDWADTQAEEILATGMAPEDSRESALVLELEEGPYTAIVSGVGATVGNGIVEIFDLSGPDPEEGTGRLTKLSTRGRVGTGDEVLIGGFIIEGGALRLITRGRGPSLAGANVADPLLDPYLALHSGAILLEGNDNWGDRRRLEIQDSGFAPGVEEESAVLREFDEGPYTAILSGVGGTTGNGIVEIFALE